MSLWYLIPLFTFLGMFTLLFFECRTTRKRRFKNFTTAEVSELSIALDHRESEEHAFVFHDVVRPLLDEVDDEYGRRFPEQPPESYRSLSC